MSTVSLKSELSCPSLVDVKESTHSRPVACEKTHMRLPEALSNTANSSINGERRSRL